MSFWELKDERGEEEITPGYMITEYIYILPRSEVQQNLQLYTVYIIAYDII